MDILVPQQQQHQAFAVGQERLEMTSPAGQSLDKPLLHAISSSSNNNKNTTTDECSSSIATIAVASYCNAIDDMKFADSISDLNPEVLWSGLVILACNETIQMSQITSEPIMPNGNQQSIVLIPLSSSMTTGSAIAPVDVLKQHVNRTGETVFRENLISIFVYIIRNLRFAKTAYLQFFIDARQLSTDDQKAALDIVLSAIYSAFLAFPDNMADIKLLVTETTDWLTDLLQGLRKRNARFGARLTTVSPPHGSETLFDTDNRSKSRKYFTQWMDFRQLTEQLTSLSDSVSKELECLASSLSRDLPPPLSADDVDKQIEEHQKALKEVFKSDDFVEFQETIEPDLQQLNDLAASLANQLPDCVYFYRSLHNRHKAIQEQLTTVVSMSKLRLNSRLEMKQILRLTSELAKEISWLNTEAAATLEKLDAPISSSRNIDSVANELADFGNVLFERLNSITHTLIRVRDAVAFNGLADKKLSPLADLLRVASDSTRDRMIRIESRIAANAEFVCKLDTISEWFNETMSFMSTLELPQDTSSPSFSPTNNPLHMLVQSASRVAQFKLDRPDPVKSPEEYFARMSVLAMETGCEELSRRFDELKSKYEEAIGLFRAKEERLDAALKQLLQLPSVNSKNGESIDASTVPWSTLAQMRLQRRILRSVSLLEQSAENQTPPTTNEYSGSSSDSVSVHDQIFDDDGNVTKLVEISLSSSENNASRHRSSSLTTPSCASNRRQSVAVLKALDEINEHLLDFERSICDNCSPQTVHSSVMSTIATATMISVNDDCLPCSPGSAPVRRASCKHEPMVNGSNGSAFTPLATDPVVMRRRPSAAFSSSSSSASCSTCRQQQNYRQSTVTSASPSTIGLGGRSGINKRFSCEVRHPTISTVHQQNKSSIIAPHELMMQALVLNQQQNQQQNPQQLNQCLLPMSSKDEQIVAELLQTECDYIASLRYVIDNYLVPLTQDCRPHPLQGKLNIVFGNVESLLDFHETLLLPELDLCRHNLFMLATCFLRAEQELSSLYVYYNTNKSRSDRLLSENSALFSSIQTRLGHKLDVASYLLKPVQRLAKYSQFLRQLIVGRSPNDVAHGQLMLAERMLSYILRHGNDLLLLEQLRGYDFALAEQGQLLRQDKLMVERKGRSRKLRHLFLFEEILVISKIHKVNGRGDFYEYKESLKICDIGLTPIVGCSGTKFEVWFRRPNSGYRYVIKADTPALRLAWTTDIEELLWRQAVAVKERRAAQFVSMGIGLRGLISLQPGSNNINSRTVNFASPNSVTDVDCGKKDLSARRPASVMVFSSSSDTDSSTTTETSATPASRSLVYPHHQHVTNKRPYSWLSSASSSGTQSSSANTPAPNSATMNATSNQPNTTSDSLTSPLLTGMTGGDRLLIPKLISVGSHKEQAFDLPSRIFKGVRRGGELISITNTAEDDKSSEDTDDILAIDDVQRLVFSKIDDVVESSSSDFNVKHCTPCSAK